MADVQNVGVFYLLVGILSHGLLIALVNTLLLQIHIRNQTTNYLYSFLGRFQPAHLVLTPFPTLPFRQIECFTLLPFLWLMLSLVFLAVG